MCIPNVSKVAVSIHCLIRINNLTNIKRLRNAKRINDSMSNGYNGSKEYE